MQPTQFLYGTDHISAYAKALEFHVPVVGREHSRKCMGAWGQDTWDGQDRATLKLYASRLGGGEVFFPLLRQS